MSKEIKTVKLPIAPVEERIINKLLLIGNGFDLALGLKTSYEDFLFWYFKGVLTKCFTRTGSFKYTKNLGACFFKDDLLEMFNRSTHVNYNAIKELNSIESFDELRNHFDNEVLNFTHHFKSAFFENIYEDSKLGWVNIEKIYYDFLKNEYELLQQDRNPDIEKLNSELSFIKNLIKEYLETLDFSVSNNNELTLPYIRQFISEIKANEVIDENEELPIVTNQILLLNFNYTPTIENILKSIPFDLSDKLNYENSRLNHIHGKIKSIENDLIFGYGDEMDKDYKDIQDLNDNRYLENFKSFKYNHSSNYRDLLRFVNANDYQVCIYGHSCGLSDRVMLNEIFEHDNCKSIKIYYYNREEFNNKNMDISRHFNSNKIMRQRIVEFNENDQIPQIKKP